MPSPTFNAKTRASLCCSLCQLHCPIVTGGKRERRRRDFLKRHAAISIEVDERKSFLARLGYRLLAHPSGEPVRMLESTGASLL